MINIDILFKPTNTRSWKIIFKENADSKIVNNYEYVIERINNTAGGSSNLQEMMNVINKYAADGWKVHTVYSNELGKNAVSIAGFGVNSTYSEDIIIFERHVQYNVALYDEKEFLVWNYAEDFPVRFGIMRVQIPVNANSLKVALIGKINNNMNIEALNVDIEFITIFNERLRVRNACFICVGRNGKEFNTEYYEIEMDKNTIKLIKAAKIYINGYVKDGVATVTDNLLYTDANNNDINIENRELYGQDYVNRFQKFDHSWKCVCGKINSDDETVCAICGRSYKGLNMEESDDILNIYEEAIKRKTTTEIRDYFVEYNEKFNSEILAEIIKELTKLASLERLYGNNKESALEVLEKYIGTKIKKDYNS